MLRFEGRRKRSEGRVLEKFGNEHVFGI